MMIRRTLHYASCDVSPLKGCYEKIHGGPLSSDVDWQFAFVRLQDDVFVGLCIAAALWRKHLASLNLYASCSTNAAKNVLMMRIKILNTYYTINDFYSVLYCPLKSLEEFAITLCCVVEDRFNFVGILLSGSRVDHVLNSKGYSNL